MPEGDVIRRTADALRKRFAGRAVQSARPQALARLAGHTLLDVQSQGKHCTLRFDNGLALHTHMRMTGAWYMYRRGQPWRKPAWTATCVLDFGADLAVLFAAPVCELVRDGDEPVQHLGPDILGDPVDLDEVLRRARAAPAATVGELLLDQRVCAGIGNIYRCEALWHHRVDPWAPPSSLDDERLGALYRTARDQLRQALVRSNLSPPRAVHARAGRPCPRCGTRIEVRAQGDQARLVYWCPRCQPQPVDAGITASR